MNPTRISVPAGTEEPLGVPLPERVAHVLRERILDGTFAPGTALTEAHLANELNVSRAPVREALRILAADGIVEVVAYKGTRVRRFERRDIEEVYSLRGQLEAFAIERLISAPRPVDLAPLDALCARMQDHAAEGDRAALSMADEAFHRTMIALTGHELLATVWDTLAIRMRFIIALRNRNNDDPMAVALTHVPIVDAIRRRDLGEARETIARHVRSAADLIEQAEDGAA